MLRTDHDPRVTEDRSHLRPVTGLRALIGSGDAIALFVAPFAVLGVVSNIAFPHVFDLGGPPDLLLPVSIGLLVAGVATWGWSVALILTHVPRRRLITTGPFSVVKHPIYTSVALLVLPAFGFLLNTWLGAAIGIVMYIATRIYAPREEAQLAETFGPAWVEYRDGVRIRWL